MALNVKDLVDAVASHAMSLGYFDRVNTHEPKNAPGNGLSCSIWFSDIEAVRGSGLNSTSVRIALNIRIMTSMIAEPQDMIDPNLAEALSVLVQSYHDDLELDNIAGLDIRMIDVLGAYGNPLRAQAGYIEQDKKIYRLFDITLPIIANDVWNQST